MGPIEYSLVFMSCIVDKKFHDTELANDIKKIASNSHEPVNNAAIQKIANEWKVKYKEYLP